MSDFDIFLDTDNELAFTVAIEGASEASVRSQFILEGPKGISLCFEGHAEGNEIFVDVPALKGLMKEGVYNTRLEVIVDDRVFTPLNNLQANIKPSIKVEAVVRNIRQVAGPAVTATVVSRKKETPIVEKTIAQHAVIASKPVRKVAAETSTPIAPVTKNAIREIREKSAKPQRAIHKQTDVIDIDNILDSIDRF